MPTLVSFVNWRMRPTLTRIRAQAEASGFFDRVVLLTERDLEPDYLARHASRMRPVVRGFGYWCWKPYVLLRTLASSPPGEVVFWVDGGCHVNPTGRARFDDYVQALRDGPSDLLGFQHSAHVGGFYYDGRPVPNLFERWWTKGDLFDYVGCRNDQSVIHSEQYASGIIGAKNTPAAREALREWCELTADRPELFDDTPSRSPNFEGFREHRHDQSYWSLLCKTRGAQTFSAFEFWYPSESLDRADWGALASFPFHARRDKIYAGAWKVLQPLERRLVRWSGISLPGQPRPQ